MIDRLDPHPIVLSEVVVMLGTMLNESRNSRGPAQRLARRIARKQAMIDEYERIAREADMSTASGRAMREYFLKRAADFREQKNLMEADLRVTAVRCRGPRKRTVAAGV
jgi:hypothetical protein